MFSGAHFDEYIADYNYMKAGAIDEDVFRMPDLCDGQKIHKLSHPPAFPLRMAALLPAVRIGELLFPDRGQPNSPYPPDKVTWDIHDAAATPAAAQPFYESGKAPGKHWLHAI